MKCAILALDISDSRDSNREEILLALYTYDESKSETIRIFNEENSAVMIITLLSSCFPN